MKTIRKGKAAGKAKAKAAGRGSARAKSAKSSAARKPAAKVARKPQAIPAGYSSITPYLIVNGGAGAIDFYKKAFGAREKMRIGAPGGKIGHAELRFGDSVVMLADEHPEFDALSPTTVGGTPVTIHLYVKNVDKTVEQAIGAGATLVRPVKDQFYGDRSGCLKDPFGHTWNVATHTEDLTSREITRRAEAMMKEPSKG